MSIIVLLAPERCPDRLRKRSDQDYFPVRSCRASTPVSVGRRGRPAAVGDRWSGIVVRSGPVRSGPAGPGARVPGHRRKRQRPPRLLAPLGERARLGRAGSPRGSGCCHGCRTAVTRSRQSSWSRNSG